MRQGDFNNLAEALDYAAEGETGINFYSGKGDLAVAIPYRQLRAAWLSPWPQTPGARSSQGRANSPRRRNRCRLCPVFLCLPVCRVGSRAAARCGSSGRPPGIYRQPAQTRPLLRRFGSDELPSFFPFLAEAVAGLYLHHVGEPGYFDALPEADLPLQPRVPKRSPTCSTPPAVPVSPVGL